MRKIFLIFGLGLLILGCKETAVEKPSNLIEKGKMIDVLYDLSLLEAVKSQNIKGGISTEEMNKFVFSKYKIDSIQFVKSNKYYASDVEGYKKMFDKVKEKMSRETEKLTGKITEGQNSTENSDTPMVY